MLREVGRSRALGVYGVKTARHALDRLKERTTLDPEIIPKLDVIADKLTEIGIGPGHYYMPLPDKQGFAAFKTVGDKNKLVLATILAQHMRPKGVPILRESVKSADAQIDDARRAELQAKFQGLATLLNRNGVYAGTAHRRITIPKDRLPEADLRDLGFEPVLIAVPEPGQDRFTSLRHPDNTYHLHSHDDRWTMHHDRHPAATMLARNEGALTAAIKGLPHVATEGIPGLYYFLKSKMTGEGLADQVESRLRPDVKEQIAALPKVAAFVRDPRANYIPMMAMPKVPPAPPIQNHADFRARLADIVRQKLPQGTQLTLPFLKTSAVTTDLQPHQQRVVDRISDPYQRGLIVAHPVGSGKTLAAIAAQQAVGLPADVVVPASLRGNFEKEIAKHTDAPPPMNIQSVQNVARKGGGLTHPFLIVDEAHRARNPTKTQAALMTSPAKKRLLLTGSLFYNAPSDVAGPVNLVSGEDTLPTDKDEFNRLFVRERVTYPSLLDRFLRRNGRPVAELNPKTKDILEKTLRRYVDYHEGSTEHFPATEEQTVRVPMSEDQRQVYKTVMGQAPAWVREKIRAGMPPTKQEASQLNAFLAGARQVSNTTAPYRANAPASSPKIEKAVAELQQVLEQNPRAKALVYSNYLDAGIAPYRSRLEELGIPFGEFTGEMPKAQRNELVKDYNADKLKALLLSSAGGEGLDLKGTRLIQVLEPHWNEEKIRQVIGRGVRYQSHDHLPPEERNVLVQRFLATHPKDTGMTRFLRPSPGHSVDEYLQSMADSKEQLNEQFRGLLKTGALLASEGQAPTEERGGHRALGVALTAGALGAGGLLLRGRRPFFSPRAAANAKKLLDLRGETNPTKYVDNYARIGSDLIRNRVFGKTTGREAVMAIRDSAPMHWLARHGVGNKYDSGSVEHYRQFARGPRAARRVMAKEIGSNSDAALYNEFKDYVGNYRPALYFMRGASGAEQALRAYGLPAGAIGLAGAGALALSEKKEAAENEEQKPRSRVLPGLLAAGLAGGAGLASYKYFRTPQFSNVPALRKFQQTAVNKGFHRPFDVGNYGDVGSGFGYKLLNKLMPHVDTKGRLGTLDRFKLWLQGGESAVPFRNTAKGDVLVKTPGRPAGNRVSGAVASRDDILQGGVDVEGPASTMKAVTDLSLAGKAREADLLQRYAPGVIADTETNLAQFLRRRPRDPAQTLSVLKQRLDQRFQGRNYAVKPTLGAQSQGKFPTRDLDWARAHQDYRAFLKNPEHAKYLKTVSNTGDEGRLAQYLRQHNMYEGHILDKLIADPRSALAQEWLPGALGEYRVHAIQGGAPTSMMANRTLKSFATNAWHGVDKEQIRRFVEKDVLAKLPAKYRRGAYGMDIMPFRNPNGTISFKVIELNPTESGMYTAVGRGSESGFLDSSMQPFGHWRAHRGMTGQRSQPEAAVKALATAGLAGAGAHLALKPRDEEKDKPTESQ